MYIHFPNVNHKKLHHEPAYHIDLDLYCCKFYNNDIEIKHKYFLLIPTHKDDTTFRIIFDSNVNPSAETVKHWANQPQYPHCVVEKLHQFHS